MRILAGTSGFAFKEWKGVFYPSDLKDAGFTDTQAETVTDMIAETGATDLADIATKARQRCAAH